MSGSNEYLVDPQGRYVPVEQIGEVDRLRDALVKEKAAEIKALQEQMRALKGRLFADIEAFNELSFERYGIKRGGKKGNVTLSSFDGSLELHRQVQEQIAFDEGILAAKALIDECLRDWTEDGPSELRAIVDYAFQVDKEGRINTARILGLRRLEIKDERWQRAMRAIGESLRVRGSSSYVRLYERGEQGKMRAVTLDFAAL